METDYVAAYHQKGVAQPVLRGSSIWVSKPWDLTYFSDMSESRLKRVWKGCKSGVKILKQGRTNKNHLWLLPFSKDSSSSSLFSRSLLFMKGNFLLKLIFCFALGPRLRVPVDLHSIKLLFLISKYFQLDLTTNKLQFDFDVRWSRLVREKGLALLVQTKALVAFWSCECTQTAPKRRHTAHVTWKNKLPGRGWGHAWKVQTIW